ncbi:MAG: hypothetical protein AB7P34_03945 [Vicinamibacterales bacterium]
MSPTVGKYARYGAIAAWIIAGGWMAGATAGELRTLWMVLPSPPEVEQDFTVRSAEDDLGRRTSFRILLFSDEFRWRINSYDAVESSSARPRFTEEMKEVLNSAREVIVVGASSEEIPAGVSFAAGRRNEERRAARRAEKIAVWVREVLRRPVPIRKLNVGHHTPTGSGETSDQRRLVIILVLDQDEGADIDQALRSAMAGESVRAPIFEALLTKYSLGSGSTFTWVP